MHDVQPSRHISRTYDAPPQAPWSGEAKDTTVPAEESVVCFNGDSEVVKDTTQRVRSKEYSRVVLRLLHY